MSATFTLQEAADELGVHYMTAYRYVRHGQLDAVKQGRTWQVSAEAIDAFRSGSSTGPVGPGSSAPWGERLEARLIEGDAQGAWGVVEAAMASGSDLRSVYLEMLTPAMVSIGARWAAGEFDIAVEHQATGMVMRIIGRLGSRCVRRGRSLGGVVMGAPAGEHHSLPTAILGDMMRLNGWDVTDLGANTPAGSFLHAALRTPELVAVGLSMSHPENLEALGECCAVIKQGLPSIRIVVGGHGFESEEQALSVGADALAMGPDHFHDVLVGTSS
jgi:excisionase family DNA binding protein